MKGAMGVVEVRVVEAWVVAVSATVEAMSMGEQLREQVAAKVMAAMAGATAAGVVAVGVMAAAAATLAEAAVTLVAALVVRWWLVR